MATRNDSLRGAVGLDLAKNASAASIVGHCQTRIFLRNPDVDASGYAKAFGLSDAEWNCIKCGIESGS